MPPEKVSILLPLFRLFLRYTPFWQGKEGIKWLFALYRCCRLGLATLSIGLVHAATVVLFGKSPLPASCFCNRLAEGTTWRGSSLCHPLSSERVFLSNVRVGLEVAFEKGYCTMRAATRLGAWLRNWREQRAQRNWLRAQHKRIVLGVYVLFAASCLLFIHPQRMITRTMPGPTVPVSSPSQSDISGNGRGAGGAGSDSTDVRQPAASALCNPFDANCLSDTVASWIASHVQSALQPLADDILGNPADIVYQTPPEDSYQNSTILTINSALIGVVDVALASMLVVGAYNVIVGQHLNLFRSSFTELLPRAILVVGAVHFNIFFLSLFIEFENSLSLAVIHAASYTMLTNLLKGLFSNPLTGLIVFILMVVLGVMVILLLIQMVTRIALVAVGLALAPLGLGCFMLAQTMRWGRLWLTTLSSSVLVQALQVAALGLGGAFITAIASTSLARLDKELATLFLAIGTLLLVLKIPGMLQTWALHPMMDGGGGWGSGSGQSQQETTGHGGGIQFGNAGGGGGGSSTMIWEDAGAGTGSDQVMEGQMMAGAEGSMVLLF